MIFDRIEWDEHNLDHATRRLTAAENRAGDPECALDAEASEGPRSRQNRVSDRWWKVDRRDRSDQILHDGVRPITGWEA